LVIGFVATLTGRNGRVVVPVEAQAFLIVGLCGGFTTFSAFSLQLSPMCALARTVPPTVKRAYFRGMPLAFQCPGAVNTHRFERLPGTWSAIYVAKIGQDSDLNFDITGNPGKVGQDALT
jgi:hypothetical protein